MIEGYDHSYFYVASVMEDHVRWHAAHLLTGRRRVTRRVPREQPRRNRLHG